MILKVRLAEISVNIDHRLYSKYIILEKGVKVLYVNLQNSLYVLLCITLLFYLKLATDLKKIVSS